MANEPVPGQDGAMREFRAWVRTHHPDAGGDPESFIAGLPAWRQRLGSQSGLPGLGHPADPAAATVTVFRTRHGLWVLERWWWRRQRAAPRVR